MSLAPFLFSVLAADRGWFEQLERDIIHLLNCRLHSPGFGKFLVALQSERYAIALFLVAAVVIAFYDRRKALRATLTAAAGFGLCMALASLMWATIDRTRPPHHYDRHLVTEAEFATCESDPEAISLHMSASGRPSFPSRHGMTIGAFVTAMWLASRWTGLLALLYGALTAVGRVYAAKHWPSDVIVGILLGIAAAIFVWRLLPWFEDRLKLRDWLERRIGADSEGTQAPVQDAE